MQLAILATFVLIRNFGVKNVPDIDELSNYNKGSFMTIVLPDGGVNPPNPSADYARELGCQFVAMRYQYVDNFLLSDTNFFDDNGYAFVQKLGVCDTSRLQFHHRSHRTQNSRMSKKQQKHL